MLSQLEYIVLCPVILYAYFGRSHGNIYQVIVTQKYSIIGFRSLWIIILTLLDIGHGGLRSLCDLFF